MASITTYLTFFVAQSNVGHHLNAFKGLACLSDSAENFYLFVVSRAESPHFYNGDPSRSTAKQSGITQPSWRGCDADSDP